MVEVGTLDGIPSAIYLIQGSDSARLYGCLGVPTRRWLYKGSLQKATRRWLTKTGHYTL